MVSAAWSRGRANVFKACGGTAGPRQQNKSETTKNIKEHLLSSDDVRIQDPNESTPL